MNKHIALLLYLFVTFVPQIKCESTYFTQQKYVTLGLYLQYPMYRPVRG